MPACSVSDGVDSARGMGGLRSARPERLRFASAGSETAAAGGGGIPSMAVELSITIRLWLRSIADGGSPQAITDRAAEERSLQRVGTKKAQRDARDISRQHT